MVPLQRILVDIDAAAPAHPAPESAVALAASHRAHVKVVDVLPCVPESARGFVTARLEAELVEHRRERLAQVAQDVASVPVTTALLRGRPASALIQEVLRSGHVLVVRSHRRDLLLDPELPLLSTTTTACGSITWTGGKRSST